MIPPSAMELSSITQCHQLLQENGYLLLRFLVEDVGKELDVVLDAILRTPRSREPVTAGPLPLIRRTPIA